jgi:protein phosphatase
MTTSPYDIPHAAATDVGLRRDHNEDAVHIAPPLLVVADGVGGSAKGEVASRLAIDTFIEAAAAVAHARSSDDAVAAMEHAVLAANTAVHQSQLQDESRRGMATTITAALVRDGGEVIVGHVGDSRLYVLSAAGARQASSDHSVVAELVRSGRLALADVATHPQRNVITRALGPEPDVSVDAFILHVGPGDWLLACSDGLTAHVEDVELAQVVLASAADPTEATRQLIELANARGGSDNITVALAQPVPSDVSGELSIEAIDAAAAASTSSIPVSVHDADEPSAGHMGDADDDLPRMEPIPHDDEWIEPRRGVRTRVWVGAITVLAILMLVVIGFVWSQSYFLVEREDGHVGIDRGFPFARLATPYRSSETIAEDLEPDDRERLVESHRLLSREDAERVLDDLPSRLDAADIGGT